MTLLAEHPIGLVDVADLAAEIEAFITHPVPYELGDGRAQLRGDARTAALANLLGTLITLIEAGQVTAGSVADAIRTALAAGAELQQQYLARRYATGVSAG